MNIFEEKLNITKDMHDKIKGEIDLGEKCHCKDNQVVFMLWSLEEFCQKQSIKNFLLFGNEGIQILWQSLT